MTRGEGGGGRCHLSVFYFSLKNVSQNTYKIDEHETELLLYKIVYRLRNVIAYQCNALTEYYYNVIVLRVLTKTEVT